MLIIVCTLFVVSRSQVGYWKNGATLFKRAVDVTENNYIAENNLGQALMLSGKVTAVAFFRQVVKIDTDYVAAQNFFKNTLAALEKIKE